MRMIKIVMIIIMMVIIMMIIIIMIIMGSGRVGAGAGWLVGAGYIFGDRGLGFARGQNRNGQHPLPPNLDLELRSAFFVGRPYS